MRGRGVMLTPVGECSRGVMLTPVRGGYVRGTVKVETRHALSLLLRATRAGTI